MPAVPQIKRVVAFVDGQALSYAAHRVFGHRHSNYDVSALAALICKQQGWTLVETRYYTGIPSASKNLAGHNFWIMKIGQMRSQGVYVFARELGYHEKKETLPDGRTETTIVPREKGVDVRIALDIVKLAYQKAYDIALIFSQDQDLAEVVYDVEEISKQQVRQINFASAYPCTPEANNKRGINRTIWIGIDRATYDACLDPHEYLAKYSNESAVTAAAVLTDEEKFLAELDSNCGLNARQYTEHILMLTKVRKHKVAYLVKGKRNRATLLYQNGEKSHPIFYVTTDGIITFPVPNSSGIKFFRDAHIKAQIREKLSAIPGIVISEIVHGECYKIPLTMLQNIDLVASFYEVVDWLIQEVKKTPIVIEHEFEDRNAEGESENH